MINYPNLNITRLWLGFWGFGVLGVGFVAVVGGLGGCFDMILIRVNIMRIV